MKIYLYAIFLFITTLAAQQLVVNPDFANLDEKAQPIGWKCSGTIRIQPDVDGMNKAVILDDHNAGLSQVLELKPEYAHLELDFWMKTTNVVQGDENWQTARLAMSFHDKSGKQVGGWPRVFGWCGTSDWRHCIRRYVIPKDAATLSFSASLFAASGMVEFKNIRFTVTATRLDKPANAPCPMHEEAAQSLEDAWTRTTPTRETVSMNGLWQFRPALTEEEASRIPDEQDCWGWFKLPAIWPDRWNNEEAYQSPLLAQYLEDNYLTEENSVPQRAWYKRTVNIPSHWEDRQIVMEFSLVNTHAKVFVDNAQAGEIWFPGGEVDLTGKLLPGKRQTIAMLVEAVPLADTLDAFMAPDRVVKNNAVVKNKGVNGDVYLTSRPKGQRITFVQAITSVQNKAITFRTELEDACNGPLLAVADVTLPDGSVKSFRPKLPSIPDEHNAIVFTSPWKNAPLWDLDSPQLLHATVSLFSADGQTLIDKTIPFTFGFREFQARGKDLYLNGTPVHLRALHCEAGTSATVECSAEPEATEMLRRMKQYGFNSLINAHYNFSFGDMNYLEGLLAAVEKNGFLMSFSLPHVKDFGWKLHEVNVRDRYTRLTRFLIRKVANNPAVVMYAMNHNACGYYGDQNPLKIDGLYRHQQDVESDLPLMDNRRNQAMHAEKIVKSLDSTRLVYHHESGNLGDLHSVNIYLNWAPLQERSDWMKHWAANGVKPVFFVEWGLPHISSWSSYRGPQFIWRTQAFQSIWATEYAAAEIGEEAYRQASEYGSKPIAHEQALWEKGKPFAWSELNSPIRNYPFYHQIMAKYAIDNWRSHRAFGVTAMLPWDQADLWKAPQNAQPYAHLNDLSILKQPGLFPDRLLAMPSQFIYSKTTPDAWSPTPLGEAFLRWNQDTCAFIAGPKENFTDKSHTFRQGESINKTIVLINDTRKTRVVHVDWRCQSIRKSFTATLQPGAIVFRPISCVVDDSGLQIHTFGSRFTMTAHFDNGDVWTDQFDFQVVPILDKILKGFSAWIYDPKGLTTKYLQEISMLELKPITADAAMDFKQDQQPIIIGREALDDPTPVAWLPDAISQGKLLVFEQSYDALTKRLGFRANIHGLRELFVTKFIHTAFRDCVSPMEENEENAANIALKNWRGASTLTPPFLDLPEHETHNPTWKWLGFENTRVWTAGNQGNVASVLIEKPTIGNWRPLAVGGFDLQYAPLLELTVDKGRTIFCQLDVTNRTENDPVGDRITCRLIHYLIYAPKPDVKRKVYYTGGSEGRDLLTRMKVVFEDYKDQSLRNDILFCAHGAPLDILEKINLNAQEPQNILQKLDRAEKNPAALIAIGLNKQELEIAGLRLASALDFDVHLLYNLNLYLEQIGIEIILEELNKLDPNGLPSFIEDVWLHFKHLTEISAIRKSFIPKFDIADIQKLIPYLRRLGFTKEANELSELHEYGIPSLIEHALPRIEKQARLAGLDTGTSLAFSYPFPSDNHIEKRNPPKRNRQAMTDYIKNKPDKAIADSAPEVIRGLTSADIYWHAKLANTSVSLPPQYENDKFAICIPSLCVTLDNSHVVICIQTAPWDFNYQEKPFMRTSYRRSVFTVAKLLGNVGAEFNNPILKILSDPPQYDAWLHSYYLQKVQAEDDPYRYYRW